MEVRRNYLGSIYAIIDGQTWFGLTEETIQRRQSDIERKVFEWLEAGNAIADDNTVANPPRRP